MSEHTFNPMAPVCGAQTRSGGRCGQLAMRNGRCRFHGGLSTGPRTAEGTARQRAAVTRHGGRTREAMELRRLVRELRAMAGRVVERA